MTDAETQKTELSQWIDSQGFSAQRDAILASADAPQDLFEASEEDLREIGGERLVCCVAAHKGDKVSALLIDAGVPQYRQRFAENDVDLDALRVLEEEDWNKKTSTKLLRRPGNAGLDATMRQCASYARSANSTGRQAKH